MMQVTGNIRTRNNKPLPSLRAVYIPLEVAFGILLLKMSPNDLIFNMKEEFVNLVEEDGTTSVERIFTNWCSSKYACDIQRLIRDNIEVERVPLILYVSIFVDGGAMNSSQTRSATPVSIAIQNVNFIFC